MESTVESIMTGTADINEVLRSNKEKIQALTSTLESIIHKGYFKIIKNTEALQTLSLNQDIPSITLPSPIEFNYPAEESEALPIEDQIWDLINLKQYTKAALVIKQSSSNPAKRIRKVLESPFYFNVFSLQEQFIDRILCLDVLGDEEWDRVRGITKFVVCQLTQRISECDSFEADFQKCRDAFSEVFGSEKEQEDKIKIIVEELIQDYLPKIKTKLLQKLENTSEIPQLEEFISNSTPKFGIPTTWSIISQEWEEKALLLITSSLSFTPLSTLQETLKHFESQSQSLVSLLKAHPTHLSSFHQTLEKSLSSLITSSIPPSASPLLILGFFTYFHELSLFNTFPSLDFKDLIENTEKTVSDGFSSEDILGICMKIKSVCGDKSLFLPSLTVTFGNTQEGFGRIVGKQAGIVEVDLFPLPKPLPLIPKVQLPLTLSTHLLLT